MNRPRIATIVSSALASALAFFILTKSGLAGTLGGAAVASIVFTSTSHWTGIGLERGSVWFRRRVVDVRTASAEKTAAPEDHASEGGTVTIAPTETLADGPASVAPGLPLRAAAPEQPVAVPGRRAASRGWRRRLVTWGPFVLGMLALGVSAYTLATGTPLERVIVRERVVEKPKVVERVVVQKQTVHAAAPTPTSHTPTRSPAAATSPATDSTSSATTTTAPRVTTSTTAPRATTTTAPRATTTTAPRHVTTTSTPSTTSPSTVPPAPTP